MEENGNSMYKTSTVAILLVMSVCLAHAQQPEALSDIKQYAYLSEDKIDLFEISLQISRTINPGLNATAFHTLLSKIVQTAKANGITNAKPRDKVFILASTLNKVFGFTIPEKPSSKTGPEYGMIDFVLSNRMGNCLGLVTLYLITADKLRLPISAETVSSHIILKYDDGKTTFYIETTTGGTVQDNLDYLTSIIKGDIITGGRDLKPLTKKGIIAELLYNAGVILSNRKNIRDAIKCYEIAIDFNSHHDDAYRAWGDALSTQEKYAEAIEKFKKAIEMNPRNDAAYTNMGLALNNLEKFADAIKAFRSAVGINPKNGYTYLNWGIALICIGQYEEARSVLRKAQELDNSLEPNVQRLMKMTE